MFLYKYLSGEIRANALNRTSFNINIKNPGIASCKEIEIPESGKFLPLECGILDFGRQELLVQCPPPGSVAFKLLIEKSFCNLTGFVQAMEILESHGI